MIDRVRMGRHMGIGGLPGSAAPTEALTEVFALKSTPVGIPNAMGADKFGSLWFTNLGQERASVRLKEFREADWSFSADLLNQIVCSGKHPILVVFRNLREVLPECIGHSRTLTLDPECL